MQLPLHSPQSAIRNLTGFTLTELLVVIAVVSILGGIAFLQSAPLLSHARLDRGARQVATDLQLVRMKAIAQNAHFRVTFHSSTGDYIVEKDEDGSWQRQVLHGHDAGPADDAAIALPTGVRIIALNSGGDAIFVPRGHVDAGMTVTLATANGEASRRVVVNLAGRVRIE